MFRRVHSRTSLSRLYRRSSSRTNRKGHDRRSFEGRTCYSRDALALTWRDLPAKDRTREYILNASTAALGCHRFIRTALFGAWTLLLAGSCASFETSSAAPFVDFRIRSVFLAGTNREQGERQIPVLQFGTSAIAYSVTLSSNHQNESRDVLRT